MKLNERKLTKAEVSKREDIIKDMKKNKRELTKRYGKDAEKVMYGRATNLAKKQLENMDPKSKLREMIKTALSSTNEEFTKKYDDDDALKGGQKDLPDGLQKSIIDKSKVKEELEDNPNYVPSRKAGDYIMNRHYDKVDWPGAIRYNDKVYHWFKQKDGITTYFDAQNPKDKLIFSSKEEMIDLIKEDKTPTPPPISLVNKRRAKADMKQFMKGKRADGMGDYDAIILGIDKDGNQTQLKTLDDFNSKYVEYYLADSNYKINSYKIPKYQNVKEDLDLGHQDDEPHMLKANLYRIGKYAMELYQMMDKFEGQGEVDLPHWWQSKIIKSESMITSAKHYLDFELKEPEIDAMVDVASEEGAISEDQSYASSFGGSSKKLDKGEIQKELNDMGYDTPNTGIWNRLLVKKDGGRVGMINTDEGYYTKNGKMYKFNGIQNFLNHVESLSEEGAISESDSYVRVSKPKYIFDKNNPNFLFVNFKYDTGGGSSIALGKETMSGQIRRLSSAEAMKQATSLAKDLEQKYNIEDIDVYDKDNGIVQIFAVSDDFINMDRINEIDNNDPMPSQEEVDRFFEETQNEMHYLASKPVMGQEKTFNNVEVEAWDEYDLSNWNALVRKKKEGRSPFSESKYSQLAEKIVKNLKKKSLSEDIKEWPKEHPSRYNEYRFELEKVSPTYKGKPGRALYKLIDIESGELKATPAFGKVEQLIAYADDLIKPQGGTQSSQFEESLKK